MKKSSGRGGKIWIIFGIIALIVALVAVFFLNQINEKSALENATSIIDIDNGDTKIDWDRFDDYEVELSETLEITKSGIYHLTGSLSDGNIIINVANGKIKLILDNVTIKNSTGPAIACYAADDLVIELIGENNLSDGKSYDSSYDEDVSGAIYSKADLTFQGEGSLNLTAKYQDGIIGKDDVKFISGIYNITASDDGIRGKDSVYIIGGNFTINAKGDGIKSTNENTTNKGFVLIEQGTINISASDDGIHAYNRLIIYDGKINITKSYEGLEAQNIFITGGEVNIIASDDGINAGGGSNVISTPVRPSNTRGGGPGEPQDPKADTNCVVEISGGKIHVNSAGDGIDSNGYLNFKGGKVVVDGPINNGNGALDAGVLISQTGGTVIAVGAAGMAESLGLTSSIYNASIYFTSTQSAGTKIEIKNSNDEVIISHTSAKTFNHIAVGTPDFKSGETYNIYINGKIYKSFTISSVTTKV